MVAQPSSDTNPYRSFHLDSGCSSLTVVDRDGSTLCETEYGGLLLEIISQNDVNVLQQYMAQALPSITDVRVGLPHYYDVFYVAAQSGSVDVLRILLRQYLSRVDTTGTKPLGKRGFLLLNLAAGCARPGVVRFLLDHHPTHTDIQARDLGGYTAILSAANLEEGGQSTASWQEESLQRSEEVMNLLLDRGAYASDVNFMISGWAGRWTAPDIPFDTVLTLAARWAGSELMTRLIDEGAEVHAKTRQVGNTFSYERHDEDIMNVTAVFTASLQGNAEAIRVLLDHRGGAVDIATMVSSPDSRGGLPLHWAARNDIRDAIREISPVELERRTREIIDAIEILLESNPATVNTQDNSGDTPLHCACRYYGQLGKEHSKVLELLCDRGADAALRNNKGETPLHNLFYRASGLLPVEATTVTLLLQHGAKANESDNDGNTPLHKAVWNLHNSDAVKTLLAHGADLTANNEKQNTPLHEAAKGYVWYNGNGEDLLKYRIDAQDGMMSILEEGDVMHQVNTEGDTPWDIRETTRDGWKERFEVSRQIRDGTWRGRGRGRGRGDRRRGSRQ